MLVPYCRYSRTVVNFCFEKHCGIIKPADDCKYLVFFGRILVEGDRDATIYEGASVEFSVMREGGRVAEAVRSSRSGTVV
nr:hypothetical protein [Tanacetum cinerariifolium]